MSQITLDILIVLSGRSSFFLLLLLVLLRFLCLGPDDANQSERESIKERVSFTHSEERETHFLASDSPSTVSSSAGRFSPADLSSVLLESSFDSVAGAEVSSVFSTGASSETTGTGVSSVVDMLESVICLFCLEGRREGEVGRNCFGRGEGWKGEKKSRKDSGQ